MFTFAEAGCTCYERNEITIRMSEISEGECSVDGKSNCPLLMAVPEIFLCMLDLQLLRPIRSTDCDMSQRKTDILP